MKPQHLKIHLQPEHSFSIRRDEVPFFYNKLHYHKELELVFITKGTGRQFIGDDIRHFKSGDMILVGENLPHLWRSDDKQLQKGQSNCEAYVIHFTTDCLGKDFFQLPENKTIANLIKRAKQGVIIKDKAKSAIVTLMKEALNATATKKIILFLHILELASTSRSTRTICRQNADFNFSPSDSERMNNIYQYIIQNFDRELTLKEIAKVACLNPNSFCRYFQSRLKKSFSTFLIEIRVGHACKLLAETEKPVAEISYECGYNNFSNFNRHFKRIARRTPTEHRKYHKEVNKS